MSLAGIFRNLNKKRMLLNINPKQTEHVNQTVYSKNPLFSKKIHQFLTLLLAVLVHYNDHEN